MRTKITLICGIVLIAILFIPWWDKVCTEEIQYTFVERGGSYSGFEVISGDSNIAWMSSLGPMLVLLGGILMVAASLIIMFLPRVITLKDKIYKYVEIVGRLIPVIALFGAIYYVIDARGTSSGTDCGGGIDGIGIGPFIAFALAIVGIICGIEKPALRVVSKKDQGYGRVKEDAHAIREKSDLKKKKLDLYVASQGGGGAAIEAARELYNMACDAEEHGDQIGAIDLYNQAIKADPTFARAYFNRATMNAKSGKRRDAIADFEKVLEHSDDNYLKSAAQKRINELSA